MTNKPADIIKQDLTPTTMAVMIIFALVLGHPVTESVKAAGVIGPDVGVLLALQPSDKTRQEPKNPATGEDTSVKKDKSGQFDVVVGGEFSLTLASNVTTGYHWELAEPLDGAIVQLVDSRYQAPNTNVIGAGGQEIWTFRAVGQGQTIIKLKYVRPWEKNVPPEETASFTVNVR